jgi:hypothetical protein
VAHSPLREFVAVPQKLRLRCPPQSHSRFTFAPRREWLRLRERSHSSQRIFHLRELSFIARARTYLQSASVVHVSPRKRSGRRRFRELRGPLTKATAGGSRPGSQTPHLAALRRNATRLLAEPFASHEWLCSWKIQLLSPPYLPKIVQVSKILFTLGYQLFSDSRHGL